MNPVQSIATDRQISPAQWRILRYLSANREWHALAAVIESRKLKLADFIALPFLVEMRLVEQGGNMDIVRITAAGCVIVEENQ